MFHRRPLATPPRVLGSAIHALLITAMFWGQLGVVPVTRAAEAEPEASPKLSAVELDELVGPIALYPDELLAIVLPASTYPIQVVQAARYLEKHKSEPDLKPDEEWDPAVLGLLNYPEVITKLNDDLDWTWKLGEAVVAQQDEVMDSVQRFRAKVDVAGNLSSNDKVVVEKKTENEQQVIIIESKSTEVIYVPSYQPAVVVVQSVVPYPYYYSPPYPYYYNPAAVFWTGMFVGAAVAYGVGWGHGGYYGHNSININRNVNINHIGKVDFNRSGSGGGQKWQQDRRPGSTSGARPGGSTARRESAKRASAGSKTRLAGGTRPSAGKRPSGDRAKAGAKRPAQGSSRTRLSDRSASGKRSTYPSSTSRGSSRSRSGSFGSYQSGSRSRSHSSRGSFSRGGGRSRGGGGMRRGGGRGGGRGRR